MIRREEHCMNFAIQTLLQRGVRLPAPETVYLAPEVVPERIAEGVVIHPGCRLLGATLAIGPECELGAESPVTLHDCQLGARVKVRGGFLERATLLDDAEAGSGAHIRPGTLLEEHASCAHAVGLKQTVLLPFTTLGSLINFCDCLMGGGTGPDNHSEVGSSYIHFNFTPHQEKATPSLIGDVPRGVLLDQPPIFLGGQGGLVGPCRIAYGTVLAAGQICRHDILTPGTLVRDAAPAKRLALPYDPRIMGAPEHRLDNNLHYLGNLLALDAWWRTVRAPFFTREAWQCHCLEGALQRLTEMFDERLKRLDQFAQKIEGSLTLTAQDETAANRAQRAFLEGWPARRQALRAVVAARAAHTPPEPVQAFLGRSPARGDYLAWVRALAPADKETLTAWLQARVEACVAGASRS
jgi:UDP-N-acetylglucosamine/UDP-N-acetylgalactosamine diphosphorylase